MLVAAVGQAGAGAALQIDDAEKVLTIVFVVR
jgi:hypothetical protein